MATSPDSKSVTYREVYELIDRKFSDHNTILVEIRAEIGKLRDEFLEFERGRLTSVEKSVEGLKATVNASQLTDAPLKKLGWKVVEYIIFAVLAAVLFLVLNR